MLIDKNTLFSDKQKLTESAPSQHIIDMGAAGNAASGGLFVVCRVEEGISGASGLTVSLQTSQHADFSDKMEMLSVSFDSDAIAAGEKTLLATAMPLGAQRYLRVHYTLEGNATAGQVSCFLTDCIDLK